MMMRRRLLVMLALLLGAATVRVPAVTRAPRVGAAASAARVAPSVPGVRGVPGSPDALQIARGTQANASGVQSEADTAGPLRITRVARALQPGEVVRLEIALADAASNDAPNGAQNAAAGLRSPIALTARAFDRDLPIIAVARGHWRALIGIDLDVAAGPHDVLFDLRDAAGRRLAPRYTLTVRDKTFPVRRLRVDPRFVEPPASAQPRIARDRARLAAAFDRSAPAPLWQGAFVMPIDTAVISNFGARSIFNGALRQPHSGADLASPTGKPIAAPNAGRIVIAGDLYFTGNTVVIDHGAGLFSLLAHLSRIDVREGEPVARGVRVGAVGATGRVTGPHLHWSVRLGAARVDPVSLIAALGGLADATDSAPPAR